MESRLANLSEWPGCYPGGTWVKISNADHALLFPFERPAFIPAFPLPSQPVGDANMI